MLDSGDAFSDSNGTTPYGDFSLRTGSGTNYPTNAVAATPDPGTWMLLALAEQLNLKLTPKSDRGSLQRSASRQCSHYGTPANSRSAIR